MDTTDATDTPDSTDSSAVGEHRHVGEKLSTLDRFLPLWIGLAMAIGIGLGKSFTGLNDTLEKVKVDTVSLPIAIGLFAMMYPYWPR